MIEHFGVPICFYWFQFIACHMQPHFIPMFLFRVLLFNLKFTNWIEMRIATS